MAVEIEIARRRLWWSGDLSDFDVLADVENARMAHRVPGDLDGRDAMPYFGGCTLSSLLRIGFAIGNFWCWDFW